MNITKKPNVILFDLDRTLLNTDSFIVKSLSMMAKELNMSYEQALITSNEYVTKTNDRYGFDFIDRLEFFNCTDEQYQAILYRYENDNSLYPIFEDVIETLKKLIEQNFRIGIFSQGMPRYQKTKLKNLKIDKYLDKNLIFIDKDKCSEKIQNRLPDECYIVDDDITMIHKLASLDRKNLYLLNRKRIYNKKLKTDEYKIIDSLTDLKI